ncbi:MAG: cell division protein FtsQ/DivIB [Steroidobacteraceae bacterium]
MRTLFEKLSGGARRRNRRRAQKPKSVLKLPNLDWKRIGAGVVAIGAVGAVAFGIRIALDQPIETVAVEGRLQRVSPLDVENAVREVSRDKGLVAVDLDAAQRAIRRIGWVDSATVRRAWPRGLRVFVVEQTPVARWGETGLLNVRGELFVNDARHVPPELPELAGPPGSQGLVTQRYLAAQGRLLEAGMRLSAVRLDPRGAWEFDLDNGVELRLGRRQVDERFDRFVVAAARVVSQRATEISYVDLRYTNGFAIGWRTVGRRSTG